MPKKKLRKILDNVKNMSSLELVGLSTLVLLVPGGSIIVLYKLLQEKENDKS